ncbi:MAG: hypothetical protein U0401_08225 [Anaerolineae bacterium]
MAEVRRQQEFEASISIQVDANDAPDVVDYPQPGLLYGANFAREGKVVDVDTFWMWRS